MKIKFVRKKFDHVKIESYKSSVIDIQEEIDKQIRARDGLIWIDNKRNIINKFFLPARI